MSAAPLRDVQACVFDAYGTLFDVHSAVGRLRAEVGPQADALSEIWRAKQLEYTWLRALMDRHADFEAVTAAALDVAAARLKLDLGPLRARLLAAYHALDAYPEVPAVLRQLRASGRRLAILSNGTPAMLAAGARHAGIAELLDAVLSVESVGIYKPHPTVYQLAVDRLGVPAAAIAFQSSNAWDMHGAAVFGLRAVWINRFAAPDEQLPGRPAQVLPDLRGLPALLGITP